MILIKKYRIALAFYTAFYQFMKITIKYKSRYCIWGSYRPIKTYNIRIYKTLL